MPFELVGQELAKGGGRIACASPAHAVSLAHITRSRTKCWHHCANGVGYRVISPMRRQLHLLLIPLVLLAAIVAWNLLSALGGYPEFILPRASSVFNRFLLLAQDGTLVRHAGLTAEEAVGGFLIGMAFGTLI